MIDKPPHVGIVAAGLAAGVLLAVCVQAYRRPVVRPIYRWVRVEFTWAAPDTRFLNAKVGPYYMSERGCRVASPYSGLVTLGNQTTRRMFYCERIARATRR